MAPGSWLGELPVGRLLGAMMSTARGCEITFAGPAALVVGHRMVEVAAGGGAPAAGEAAPALPDHDQVPQRTGRAVTGRLARMAAAAGLQDLELGSQASRPPDERLVCCRTAGRAAVTDRQPIGVGDGQAPSGGGALGELCGQLAARERIDRPVASNLTRLVPAEPSRHRHGQVDRARHRPVTAGRSRVGVPSWPCGHSPCGHCRAVVGRAVVGRCRWPCGRRPYRPWPSGRWPAVVGRRRWPCRR